MATCCGLATYPILLRVIRNLRRAERQALRARKEEKKRLKQVRAEQATHAAAKPSTEPAGDAARMVVNASSVRQSVGVQQRTPV